MNNSKSEEKIKETPFIKMKIDISIKPKISPPIIGAKINEEDRMTWVVAFNEPILSLLNSKTLEEDIALSNRVVTKLTKKVIP